MVYMVRKRPSLEYKINLQLYPSTETTGGWGRAGGRERQSTSTPLSCFGNLLVIRQKKVSEGKVSGKYGQTYVVVSRRLWGRNEKG